MPANVGGLDSEAPTSLAFSNASDVRVNEDIVELAYPEPVQGPCPTSAKLQDPRVRRLMIRLRQ